MLLRIVASISTIALIGGPSALAAQARSTSASGAVDCAKVNDATVDHATMDHSAHNAVKDCETALPTLPGQAAYGAIGEVVRLLEADPKTDWTRVNVEALRQHLIDMDEVTLHAGVAQRSVANGAAIEVTGSGRTAAAIKRMVINHARALDQGPEYHAVVEELANGARLTITAKNAADQRVVARIRGLGFAGLMTEGDHHAAHHMALARGDAEAHGR